MNTTRRAVENVPRRTRANVTRRTGRGVRRQPHVPAPVLIIYARAFVPLVSALFACLCIAALSNAQTPSPALDARLGERIYREGILPDGRPARASVQGDVEVEGTQLNCAGCHRRSGFGSTEGAAFVPSVTGAALYGKGEPNGADLFRRLFQ